MVCEWVGRGQNAVDRVSQGALRLIEGALLYFPIAHDAVAAAALAV